MQRFLGTRREHVPVGAVQRLRTADCAHSQALPAGVAAVYATPQLGADGVLEWWTSQQGMVTSYAALSADAQQALLRAYDAHLATLDGLIEAMRARGLAERAGQIEALRTPPALDRLYSVDGRLLVRLQQDPEPHPSSRWRPARRRCVGGAWRWAPCSFWRRCLPCCGGGSGIPWRRRPLRPLLPCPCPYRCLCRCRCQNQDPNPSQSQSPSPNEIPSGLRSSPLSWKRRIA